MIRKHDIIFRQILAGLNLYPNFIFKNKIAIGLKNEYQNLCLNLYAFFFLVLFFSLDINITPLKN